jgi:tetratricopeptide (TPR) repeat protein
MWIERLMPFLICVMLAYGAGFSALAPAAEGQYRSKVLISPAGEMTNTAELSIGELEQRIGSIEQPYAKSSAGRHLARHYVEQGEYDKAIEYYRAALSAQGLSDVADREMLRELARVYLLTEDYKTAVETLQRVLLIELIPEAGDYLRLARAHHQLGKYVAVVATLDDLGSQGLTLEAAQMQQALALYYRAGAYAQCEALLQKLLILEPDNPQNWHFLVSVYLQQDKKRQALDQLALAAEKSVPFTERDTLLLVDLQAANNNPYAAAETLSAALEGQQVDANGENYRKLFEFWFLARENARAQQALERAAQLTGDTQLYLYLAQLQMDQQSWQDMHQTMLATCAEQLQDQYVSRANLLLGVSQLKLGDTAAARRSFINASMIGGAHAQAGQWLEFMKAPAATPQELRQIVGLCYGSEDKRASVSSAEVVATAPAAVAPQDDAEPAAQGLAFQTRTVPSLRLYYVEQKISAEQLAGKIQSLTAGLKLSLVKSGGTATGPLHIISYGPQSQAGEDTGLQLALPVRGLPSARGRYKTRRSEPFKCAYLNLEGSVSEMEASWAQFAAALMAEGYELTGERRLVMDTGSGASDGAGPELQLGIR